MTHNGDWSTMQKLVMQSLKQHGDKLDQLHTDLADLQVQVAILCDREDRELAAAKSIAVRWGPGSERSFRRSSVRFMRSSEANDASSLGTLTNHRALRHAPRAATPHGQLVGRRAQGRSRRTRWCDGDGDLT